MRVIPRTADPWSSDEQNDLSALVSDVKGLVTPPHVFLKVTELMRSADASAKDFQSVIAIDPNLSARLLRIANSSFYSFASKVDTVTQAVAVIGMSDLYNLVTAVSAVKSFSRITNDLVSMDTFWRHSIMTGLIARNLAKHCSVLHGERLFVTGLLHDIGSLVLFNKLPELSRDLMLITKGDEDALFHAEWDTLGFTHAHVAAQLLGRWQLPATLSEAIAGHHDPASVGDARLDATLIQVADIIVSHSDLGRFVDGEPSKRQVPDDAWEVLGVAAGSINNNDIIGETQNQFVETVASLGLKP